MRRTMGRRRSICQVPDTDSESEWEYVPRGSSSRPATGCGPSRALWSKGAAAGPSVHTKQQQKQQQQRAPAEYDASRPFWSSKTMLVDDMGQAVTLETSQRFWIYPITGNGSCGFNVAAVAERRDSFFVDEQRTIVHKPDSKQIQGRVRQLRQAVCSRVLTSLQTQFPEDLAMQATWLRAAHTGLSNKKMTDEQVLAEYSSRMVASSKQTRALYVSGPEWLALQEEIQVQFLFSTVQRKDLVAVLNAKEPGAHLQLPAKFTAVDGSSTSSSDNGSRPVVHVLHSTTNAAHLEHFDLLLPQSSV